MDLPFNPKRLRSLIHRPELLTPAEMARADAASVVPISILMQNAGWAVARAIAARIRPCRTLVLAGAGNNGGDGCVAARLLAEQGWPVSVAFLAAPRPGSAAAEAAARWRGPRTGFTPAEAARADLVIDAVFGAGLSRDVAGFVAATLGAARRIVAVDVPSGVDGETGMVRGAASAAEMTVTFFRLKPGHLLLPGRDLCGETVLADIGLPDTVLTQIKPSIFANTPDLWELPALASTGHKYGRGHVTVLGGATMTGAARLAAEAARHAGAGLVTIVAMGASDTYRASPPGTIITDDPLPLVLADTRRQVWVCGPGLGTDAARETLPVLLRAGKTVVGDADVFSAFAGAPEGLRGAAVLTPHAGEFTRAFGPTGADRVAAMRAAACLTGAVVLLKGSDTIIAGPDGRVAINAAAPPWLATAGAGDVLAGVIGALLAQGMPPWEATAAGVWLHGQAAAIAGRGMVVEDLLPALRRAWAMREINGYGGLGPL